MIREVDDLISKGRLDESRTRYADFKEALARAVVWLLGDSHGLTSPRSARGRTWHSLHLLVSGNHEAPGRIEAVAAGLGLNPETELAFLSELIAPLDPASDSAARRSALTHQKVGPRH